MGRGVDKRQQLNRVPKRVKFDGEPDVLFCPALHPSDSLGQTVGNPIKLSKKTSVVPSVAIALAVPLGWCSTMVVGSEHQNDVSVTTKVDWKGRWAQWKTLPF